MKKADKYLIVSGLDSGGLGGAEIYLYQLSDALKKYGYNTAYFSVRNTPYTKYLKKKQKKVFFYPQRLDMIGNTRGLVKAFIFLIPTLLLHIIYLLKVKKKLFVSPVVLMSGFSDKVFLTPIAKILSLKVVWIEFSSMGPVFDKNMQIPRILYDLVKNMPDKIIVCSENTKVNVVKDHKIKKNKLTKIPLGLSLLDAKTINKYKSNRKITKNKYQLNNNFIIGNVSRLEWEKGQDELIKAFSHFNKLHPDSRLVLVGTGMIENQLKSLVAKLSMKKAVVFTGLLNDSQKWDMYASFDVFVFPTRWKLEGFGLVPVEARMFGLPVIASNHPPVDEVMKGQALFCAPNANEILRSLIKVYKKQYSLPENNLSKYDINNVAKKYLTIFEEPK